MPPSNAARATTAAGGSDPQKMSSCSGSDSLCIDQKVIPPQAESRPSAAVFELLCETQVDEILALCSELASHAEIACGYASIRNERGLNYAVNCIVQLAIRAGDENLMLRCKRAEARAAEADRRQCEGAP